MQQPTIEFSLAANIQAGVEYIIRHLDPARAGCSLFVTTGKDREATRRADACIQKFVTGQGLKIDPSNAPLYRFNAEDKVRRTCKHPCANSSWGAWRNFDQGRYGGGIAFFGLDGNFWAIGGYRSVLSASGRQNL